MSVHPPRAPTFIHTQLHTLLHLPVPRAPASPRAPPHTPLYPQTEGCSLYMHKSHVATHPIPRAQQRDPRWSPHDPIFRHTRTNTTRPAAENGSAKGCSAPGTHRRQARALAQTLQTLHRRCSCSPIQCLSAQRCFTNPWATCTAPPRFDPCLGNLPRTPLGLGEVQDGRRASGGPRKERWLFIWLSRARAVAHRRL